MNGNFCKIFCKNVKKCEKLLFFVLFINFCLFCLFVKKELVEFFSCVFVVLNLSCVFLWQGFGDFWRFCELKSPHPHYCHFERQRKISF